MAICGPKCSLCCLIISSWGIVQLVVMGVFYWVHAVALLEDIPLPEEEGHFKHPNDFYKAAEDGYQMAAMNCWIAACLYVLTFIVSGHQFYMNSRTHV